MQIRRGVSPFIATVILVAITLTLGGVLYTQFRQVVTAEVRNPSVSLVGANVGSDRQTLTLTVKNDGNVELDVQKVLFQYGATNGTYLLTGGNVTVLSGAGTMEPGDVLSVQFKAPVVVPDFAAFTVTVVTQQLASAFTIQA
jgi:flagellin-like protein